MLPLLILSHLAMSIAAPPGECDLSRVPIINGTYTVTDGGKTGSKVKYSCPDGMYPYPGFSRECLRNGKWTQDRIKAACKTIQCPRPISFEGGDYFPQKQNKKYYVGDVLTFECWSGYKMSGPGNHTCLENGKWSGELTICDDQEGHCPNPGIPFGATKVGLSYKIENTVTYECQDGLKMFGSNQRQCLENKEWSGAQPTCRDYYTYDTPEEVASGFSASISEAFESADPDKIEVDGERKVKVEQGGLMNIFLVLDASQSVGVRNFQKAKEICKTFLEKVSTYDFVPRYAVISYATNAIKVVKLNDEDSVDADKVIEKLEKYRYKEHDDKQGTNTRGALYAVHEMLSLDLQQNPDKFLKTRNVILLMTDGKHNMGGDPTVEVKRMKQLLEISNNREDYLDVYVFGLGDDVSEVEINDIASKKNNEKHVFLLKNIDNLKKAFDEMIDDVESFQMCGLSKEPYENQEILPIDLVEAYPWIAKIFITRGASQEKCKGSVVSKNFVLTAAHCFHLDEEVDRITVDIGNRQVKVKDLYRHPKYDPAGKVDKNVKKSFDYDIALLELKAPLQFSRTIRPICIPCTKSATWALKQRGKDVTCDDHKRTLLSDELVKAMFIAEETQLQRMNVLIKQGSKRQGCLDDTKKVKEFENVADITDVVTDNFLCTGGIEPQVDPQTCKGDSGGPLILPIRKRYIQVGVISWGTVNSCKESKRNKGPVPAESRDFHADVFTALDWLKETIKEDLDFFN